MHLILIHKRTLLYEVKTNYLHFNDDKADVERGKISFPQSHSWQVDAPEINPGALATEHTRLTIPLS